MKSGGPFGMPKVHYFHLLNAKSMEGGPRHLLLGPLGIPQGSQRRFAESASGRKKSTALPLVVIGGEVHLTVAPPEGSPSRKRNV